MATRILCSTILTSKHIQLKTNSEILGSVHYNRIHSDVVPVKEVRIPVEFGHLSAKLWGSNDQDRPILALHGWQDNAGTWDPLAPMLAQHRAILAVDLPGHGLSSWIPKGVHYYAWELPRLILKLKNYFNWDKVSLLSHSMGSIASLRFASIFQEEVDFYIAIDSLVYDDYDLNLVIDKYPTMLKKLSLTETRLSEEPPAYTIDQITKAWHLGTMKSVELDSVKYLLKRGAKPSKADPNKFYFSRDPRLKHTFFNPENKMFVEALVKRLACPTLYIKAIDSPFASDTFSVEMRELIEKNNKNYECQFVPGTHHVHLNNPERVAPHILNFLKKYNLKI